MAYCQMPMGVPGFGGAPVYVVMPSPGAGSSPGQPPGAYLQDFLKTLPNNNNNNNLSLTNHQGVTIYELPDSAQQHHHRVSVLYAYY